MPELKSMESVLNLAEAMNNLDGDAELLEEIVEIFLETAPQQFEFLEKSILNNEADNVSMESHGMKGGASNFCANSFMSEALKLETLAKSGSLDGAADHLAKMKETFAELKDVLEVVNWAEIQRDWDS